MARTRAEIEKLQAELEQELLEASDYDDDEVWVERNGDKFLLKGPKAKVFLAKHRDMWEEAKEEAEEELEDEPEKPAKKAVAKKTATPRKRAAAKPVEAVEDEVEEELELDEPEPKKDYWG
jgi:hypothetical protein